MRDWSGINIHYLWAAVGMQVVFVSVTETDIAHWLLRGLRYYKEGLNCLLFDFL